MEAAVSQDVIPATLDLADADVRTWDAIIIGAGPTGSLAARQLALHGVRVLLVDRAVFPRWKVCGCCLSGRAVSVLERIGLLRDLQSQGAIALQKFELRSGKRSLSLPISAGCALSRTRLDALLLRAAITAGADFLPQTEGRLGSLRPEVREVLAVQSGAEAAVRGKVVLVCEGLSQRVIRRNTEFHSELHPNSYIGAGAVAQLPAPGLASETVFMAVGRAGYVGAVHIEDRSLNLAAALHPQAVTQAGSLGSAADQVLKEAGLPLPVDADELNWQGTPRLTRTTAPVAARRTLILGDAAGYVEPFTGEGMGWGLASAADSVPLVLKGIDSWSDDIEMHWTRYHARRVRDRQKWCRRTASLLRKPVLLSPLISIVNMFPSLANPVMHHLNAGWDQEDWKP